jgi:hypothetical protein
MSDTRRVVLVSEGDEFGDIISAYHAAADQPRIQWCEEHGQQASGCQRDRRLYDLWEERRGPCRVVPAIVCVLDEPQSGGVT